MAKRRPRICVYSKAWRSGTGWFIHSLVENLAKTGCDVTFICPLGTFEYEPRHPTVARRQPPRELPVSAPKLYRLLFSLLRFLYGTFFLLQARTRTRDFLISIPDPLVVSLPVIALLRLSGAHIVYVVHDVLPHAWYFGVPFRWLERFCYLLSYKIPQQLVVLAESARATLKREFGICEKKIKVIPHVPFILGEANDIPGHRQLLLFGVLRRNKCILEGIAGILLARDRGLSVTLVIAGEPHNEDYNYWKECLALAEGKGSVIDLRPGYVPQDQLGHLISNCDALLLPYQDFTSQSGVAMLAASNKRPVIASAVGGLREMFAGGLPGVEIQQPVTAEHIADAVETFYTTGLEKWKLLASAYQRNLATQSNWDRITASYLALFQQHRAEGTKESCGICQDDKDAS
jgi:glycogen(starch) synthase